MATPVTNKVIWRIKKLKVSDIARDDDTRVIGYFAYTSPMHAICDGDACVIAESEAGMKRYVEAMVSGSLKGTRIKKTRFGEVLKGLELGADYSFSISCYSGHEMPCGKCSSCLLRMRAWKDIGEKQLLSF